MREAQLSFVYSARNDDPILGALVRWDDRFDTGVTLVKGPSEPESSVPFSRDTVRSIHPRFAKEIGIMLAYMFPEGIALRGARFDHDYLQSAEPSTAMLRKLRRIAAEVREQAGTAFMEIPSTAFILPRTVMHPEEGPRSYVDVIWTHTVLEDYLGGGISLLGKNYHGNVGNDALRKDALAAAKRWTAINSARPYRGFATTIRQPKEVTVEVFSGIGRWEGAYITVTGQALPIPKKLRSAF